MMMKRHTTTKLLVTRKHCYPSLHSNTCPWIVTAGEGDPPHFDPADYDQLLKNGPGTNHSATAETALWMSPDRMVPPPLVPIIVTARRRWVKLNELYLASIGETERKTVACARGRFKRERLRLSLKRDRQEEKLRSRAAAPQWDQPESALILPSAKKIWTADTPEGVRVSHAADSWWEIATVFFSLSHL